MAKRAKATTDPLALKLKALRDGVVSLQMESARCREKLKLIEKKKGAAKALGSPYGDILGLCYLGWCVASYFLFIGMSWFAVIVSIVIVVGIVEAVITKVLQGRFSRQLAELEPMQDAAEDAFELLIQQKLMPRIHALQMATVQNIKDQTAASSLPDEVIEALLDVEVDEDRMERIDLNDGDLLFKSLVPEGALESHELTLEQLSGRTDEGDGLSTLPLHNEGVLKSSKWYLNNKVIVVLSVASLFLIVLVNGSREQAEPASAKIKDGTNIPAMHHVAEDFEVLAPAEVTTDIVENEPVELAPVDAVAAMPLQEVPPVEEVELVPVMPELRVQPSFDCAKSSSAVEHMICGNQDLAELDQEMAVAYRRAFNTSSMAWALRDTQQAWIKNRNICTSTQCVGNAYKNRIIELNRSHSQPASPRW